ncbi:hypothetical protein [Neptunitalea lumnitzerae]|nr:hypothetical protein [Neptunitalea sp. Y10]
MAILVTIVMVLLILRKDCSGDSCMVNVIGLVYLILWVVCYIPWLFIVVKKLKLTFYTERVLFFLPSILATIVLVFLSKFITEINLKIGLIGILPHTLLQLLFFLYYRKKVKQ